MAKKELTEEEVIAELQKKIDAYNKKIGKPGTMSPAKPGGGRRPKPGDTIMRPTPVKPGGGIKKPQPIKPGKPTRPGDSINKPGRGMDKVYRPERDGPKGTPAEQRLRKKGK
jgi:hypothetical protein